MANLTQAGGALLDGVVISATATGVLTKELAGTSIDIVRGIRKPVKDGFTTIGNYSEEMVSNSEFSLNKTKFENQMKLEVLEEMKTDKAYITSFKDNFRNEVKGVSSEIQF